MVPRFPSPSCSGRVRSSFSFSSISTFSRLETLLLQLAGEHGDDLKREAAHRWESALDDTVDFLTGNYISDDEQVFFAHKEEDE